MTQELDVLDKLGESESLTAEEPRSLGAILIHRYFFEGLGGKGAKHILFQFLFFYAILLVGFVCLYVMFKSTQQIRSGVKNLKKNVGETLRAQHARRFTEDDYRGSAWI
eukprot:CAMPEP_0202341884 /NCGR_PEP_ID=MMETSP1126-20121109/2685_1 /ASSEMBLY_ACC=CAM_ASM_000457 /TAXON_ID=3047 /ORGANISM="Dunaliella tertiolecta, Strain CCMP1320" /LENGTH=108 /DNA_ID=CAMNT_0048932759 /DNA_START=58 /DNA_END=384 /DNA_ORIENTATION=-